MRLVWFIILFCSYAAVGQEKSLNELEHLTKEAVKVMKTDKNYDNRKAAFEAIGANLKQAFSIKGSYQHDFVELEGVSMLKSPDNKFRLFTWELFENDSVYNYGGIIQLENGKSIVLNDKSAEVIQTPFVSLNEKKWYGVLYYKIIPFRHKNATMYAVLGFDSFSFFARRKLVDVLYFEGDKVRFGAPVFDFGKRKSEKANRRFLITYSVEAKARMSWDEQFQGIVFDNLIWGADSRGMPAMVTDGTYSILKYDDKKQLWVYEEDIFKNAPNLINGEAPVFKPKTKSEGLFRPK